MKRTLSLLIAVPLVLGACSSGDQTEADGPLDVELADYTITPARSSAATGPLTFSIRNTGKEIHELLVVRTDLGAENLPTDENGDVLEDGEGLEFIDEREGIKPDGTDELPVDLDPGKYVLLCNLPQHYAKGMAIDFTVTGKRTGKASSTTAPEDLRVDAATVAKGLRSTITAMNDGKPADDLYELWFGYEGTIRANDQELYLAMEDQLAAIKHSESDSSKTDPAVAREAAVAEFTELAEKYLAANPG